MPAMAMTLKICTLSPKRLELLEEDPDMVIEIMTSREEIPGLFRFGKAWDAMSHVVKLIDDEGALQRVLRGEAGTPFGPALSQGRARLVSHADVLSAAKALAQFPADGVKARVRALAGTKVHGDYFPKIDATTQKYGDLLDELDDDKDDAAEEEGHELSTAFDQLRIAMAQAVTKRESLLVAIV